MMTSTEILKEIKKLPLSEQKNLREELLNDFKNGQKETSQDEFDRILFEDGFLANLPDETEENDDFEPMEFTGKPISETIIEERR